MLINSVTILCVYLCDILVTFTPLSSLTLLPPSQAPPPFFPVCSTGFDRSYLYGQDCEAVHGHPTSSAVAAFLRSMTSSPTSIPKRPIALWAGLGAMRPHPPVYGLSFVQANHSCHEFECWGHFRFTRPCLMTLFPVIWLPGVGDMGIPLKVGTQQSLVLDNLASHESALQREDFFFDQC